MKKRQAPSKVTRDEKVKRDGTHTTYAQQQLLATYNLANTTYMGGNAIWSRSMSNLLQQDTQLMAVVR